MTKITSTIFPAVLLAAVAAAGCEAPPDEPSERTDQAWASTAAGNILYLTKGSLCNQPVWGPGVNGHAFASRETTVNVFNGRTEFVAGHLSHILNWRPDDEIYFTIPFEGGMPKKPEITIDHGGVASWFKILSDVFILTGIGEVNIPGLGKKKIDSTKAAVIATEVSHRVEGRGWEAQAAAVINMIGLYATMPGLICSMGPF